MKSFIAKITGLPEDQVVDASLAAMYIFFVLGGYYVLKPLRDEMVLLLGKEFIPRLFIYVLIVTILANPIFSYLMNRFSRVGFIKCVYRFFALNLLGFIAVFKYLENTGQMVKGGEAETVAGLAFWVGAAFYTWVSVFNLFVVSIFWALMADLYKAKDSKKLFGFVGAGGTLGQLVGSTATKSLVAQIGPTNVLFITVIALELAVWVMNRLTRDAEASRSAPDAQAEDKPSAFSGVQDILKSRYLLGICLYMFLFTFSSTFLYFQKQELVDVMLSDRETRVQFFATISQAISALTLFVQFFLTGRLIPLFGLTAGLSLVPVVTFLGFTALSVAPSLAVLAVVEVCRSTANYGITRPSREILYTAVSKREKYLSKSFIDTFVYRAGDTIAAGGYDGLKALTSNPKFISTVASVVAIFYLISAVFLGKAYGRKSAEAEPVAQSGMS